MQMRRKSARGAAASLVGLALLLPAPALAEADAEALEAPESPALELASAGFDLLALRPLALVTTAVGACFFAPAALLSAPAGLDRSKDALDLFVLAPWEDLATRPLGEF